MTSARAALALARFELARRARSVTTTVAAALLVGDAALVGGLVASGRVAADDAATLFVCGQLLALAALLRFDYAEDRRLAFTEYLVPAFIGAGAYLAGKAAALAVLLVGHAALVLATVAWVPGGGPALALWLALLWPLLALLAAPAILVLERIAGTRLPALLLLALLLVIAVTGLPVTAAMEVLELLGVLGLRAGDVGGLGPLALRSLVIGPLGTVAAFRLLEPPPARRSPG